MHLWREDVMCECVKWSVWTLLFILFSWLDVHSWGWLSLLSSRAKFPLLHGCFPFLCLPISLGLIQWIVSNSLVIYSSYKICCWWCINPHMSITLPHRDLSWFDHTLRSSRHFLEWMSNTTLDKGWNHLSHRQFNSV